MPRLQGQLLLAGPELADPNFHHTVVLIIEHGGEGAFGVVLNRSSRRTIKEVLEAVTDEAFDTEQTIQLGGPVAGPLIALHASENLAEMKILPGVFVATSRDHLLEIARQSVEPYRIYSGYAGWAANQIESELEAGAWITTPAKPDYIFHEEDDLWGRVARDIVNSVIGPALNVRHGPVDPSRN